MPVLKNNPVLRDYQNYVTNLGIERGFVQQTTIDKCLLPGEEMGDLFKVVRKSEGLCVDSHSNITDIEDGLADMFKYLCALANQKKIELEAAFLDKEEKNKKRTWKSETHE